MYFSLANVPLSELGIAVRVTYVYKYVGTLQTMQTQMDDLRTQARLTLSWERLIPVCPASIC